MSSMTIATAPLHRNDTPELKLSVVWDKYIGYCVHIYTPADARGISSILETHKAKDLPSAMRKFSKIIVEANLVRVY